MTEPSLALPRVLSPGQRLMRYPFEWAGLGLFAIIGVSGVVQVQVFFEWGIFTAAERLLTTPFSIGWSSVVIGCVALALVSFWLEPIASLLLERVAMVSLAIQFGALGLALSLAHFGSLAEVLPGEAIIFLVSAAPCALRAIRINRDLAELRAVLAAV
jgi:hypothetical protein